MSEEEINRILGMPEPEFRKEVIFLLRQYGKEHKDTLDAVKRVEANTRLARNIQDMSKAARIVGRGLSCIYSVLGGIARAFLKISGVFTVLYIGTYMAFHGGEMPHWANNVLTLIRRD